MELIPWDQLTELQQRSYLEDARAALDAVADGFRADRMLEVVANAITNHPENRLGTPESRHPVSIEIARTAMDVLHQELEARSGMKDPYSGGDDDDVDGDSRLDLDAIERQASRAGLDESWREEAASPGEVIELVARIRSLEAAVGEIKKLCDDAERLSVAADGPGWRPVVAVADLRRALDG